MISKSSFKDINQAVWHTQTKIIFVGDDAQLPPVGELEPVIATYEYITNQATLSLIVRYDGDIARVAEEIRSDKPNGMASQRLYAKIFYRVRRKVAQQIILKFIIKQIKQLSKFLAIANSILPEVSKYVDVAGGIYAGSLK